MLPLVGAERCWAAAMEMRAQLEKEPLSYKRRHAARRMAKAAQLAGQVLVQAMLAPRCCLPSRRHHFWGSLYTSTGWSDAMTVQPALSMNAPRSALHRRQGRQLKPEAVAFGRKSRPVV